MGWVCALLPLMAACSSYDAALIASRGRDPDAGPGGVMGSAGTSAVTDAAQAGGGGMAGAAAGEGGSGAGEPGPGGKCKPNPNRDDQVCPLICPELCNDLDDDCDRLIDEQDANQDCARPHTQTLCEKGSGKCLVTACLDNYRDCDDQPDNGCEIAPDDPENCGLCGHACEVAGGSPGCKNGKCTRKACDALRADCDDDPLTCETPTDTLADCGDCDVECKNVAHASPSCASGSCGIEECNAGYDDCDAAAATGCEQRLDTLAHCGACGRACEFVGSQAECASTAGVCQSTGCELGYDECDDDFFNGCESLKSGSHCGSCGKACTPAALEHVTTAACGTGACVIACEPGWGNCDGDAQSGCETKLDSLTHCGACGMKCERDNAVAMCTSGTCEIDQCESSLFADCNELDDDGCETPLDTLDDCNACDVTCDEVSCAGGVCTAADCSQLPFSDDCGGARCGNCDSVVGDCETRLDTDLDNCGACGNLCAFSPGVTANATLSCVAQSCKALCAPGFGDCDGDYRNGCERPLTTLTNCGGCGQGCAIANGTATCGTGSCEVASCNTDFDDCDGDKKSCESALNTPSRCGSCNNACSFPNAVEGCGGTPAARVCTVAACEQPYFRNCDNTASNGCEIDARSNKQNCNTCGNDCEALPNVATAACANSACSVTTCDTGFGDCTALAGCETPLSTVQNCGACGNNCDVALANTASTSCDATTRTCKIGSCDPGFANCDGNAANGCETNIYTVQNCGGCANMAQNQACQNLLHANTACGAGTCTLTSCQTDWADCDGTLANGCERDARTPANGGLGPCLPDTGCVKSSSAGHDYYVCPTARSWLEARSKCQLQRYGDLARIDAAAEATFVGGKLAVASWIGNTDQAHEGLWSWADNGVPFWQGTAGSGTAIDALYTNWAGSEPNDSGNCGQLYLSGQYDDTGCTSAKPFVCEVNPDSCASDAAKYDPGQCGCGNPDTDADSDGFAVCKDSCEADSSKRAPGVCGCGSPDTNTDGDSQVDCLEACDADPLKLQPGVCGCGMADTDSDSDTFANCIESCDNDAAKQDPGICGCGVADTNTDGDSQANCLETCDSDPLKLAPGMCGCGVADTNTDGDSQADCIESCDGDPLKLVPGVCDCGVADTNTDGDSQADCLETCDSDPLKLAPGQCGCGVADIDTDADGTANCNDGCDADPSTTGACFPFTQGNFDPNGINFSTQPNTTLNCGTTTINTSLTVGMMISNWCGTAPVPVIQTQTLAGGPQIVVIPLSGLTIAAGATLRLIGDKPVVIAVRGNVTVNGIVDANGSGTTPGAGGNVSCGSSVGSDGSGSSSAGGGGGGGGAFGTAGGRGGTGDGASAGNGGAARGTTTQTPLLGGCAGGKGGGCGSPVGAAGGGALQIAVSGTLDVNGTLRANGGVGTAGCGSEGGGTGGGSGGGILLQAGTLDTAGATITANGGAGGSGSGGGTGGGGSTSSSSAGSVGGSDGANGGGGGGGGYGRVRLN